MTVTATLIYIPAAHYNLCCHSDEGVEIFAPPPHMVIYLDLYPGGYELTTSTI